MNPLAVVIASQFAASHARSALRTHRCVAARLGPSDQN